jgi:hypothetical protein
MPRSDHHSEAVAIFTPAQVRRFRFLDWRLDGAAGRIELGYALDGLELREVIDLGGSLTGLDAARLEAVHRAARLLHMVAGVSYYKSCFAPEITVEGDRPDPAVAAFLRRLYDRGLAECRFTNRLPDVEIPEFPAAPAEAPAAPPAGLGVRPMVPVGGGKDSIVTLEAVRRVHPDALLFSVGAAPAALRTAEVAGLPRVSVTRTLAPGLLGLNRVGAYNGHVPVTAINSCLAVIAALIHGSSEVVMADERSASVGSFVWQGTEVNHQYSKSWEFEQRFAAVVRRLVAADLTYFSLLRPWSELAIARAFAGLPAYHRAFVSCNRAFLIDPDRRAPGWCGDCAKCRFVSLALAPFLDRGAVSAIVGGDLLGEPSQVPGFAALLGMEADKPLECVGEIEEARVAMRLLLDRPGWREAAVVHALGDDPRVRGLRRDDIDRVLAPSPPHALPDAYRRFADALD